MSLKKASVSPGKVVGMQVTSKLNAYYSMFGSLLFAQVLALLFSFGGVGSMGTSDEAFSVMARDYNGDIILFFTLIWGIISAVLLTTESYKNDHYAFVANRLTNNLSNILILIGGSLMGGITAMMASLLLKILSSYTFHANISYGHFTGFNELLLGMWSAFLYLLFIMAIGYFIGCLTKWSKYIGLLIPIAIILELFFGARSGSSNLLIIIGRFYISEHSIFVFTLKVLVTVVVLLSGSIILSNRMEVRA